MLKTKFKGDPRGHSIRIYDEIFDSHAFNALSAHDKVAYLALLRELRGYNNGDLSLPLTRAKKCGIHHHVTLAKSLRALCAVGLIAKTRQGGCTRGGQRLPNLYRVTDCECHETPKKFIEAMRATNDWKMITSLDEALEKISEAEKMVKRKIEKYPRTCND